jgi:hypothetical protein
MSKTKIKSTSHLERIQSFAKTKIPINFHPKFSESYGIRQKYIENGNLYPIMEKFLACVQDQMSKESKQIDLSWNKGNNCL